MLSVLLGVFPAELRRVRRITADFIRDNSSFWAKNLFPADYAE